MFSRLMGVGPVSRGASRASDRLHRDNTAFEGREGNWDNGDMSHVCRSYCA